MSQKIHLVLNRELRCDIDAVIQRLERSMEDKASGSQGCRYSAERAVALVKLREAAVALSDDIDAINAEEAV